MSLSTHDDNSTIDLIKQPRPQGLLLVQNGGSEKPWSGSKNPLEFRHVNTTKCLRLTVSDCRKQTGPPYAGNNLRKSHFIMCHVTKYSTILGVFQQPWPGVSPIRHFERGESPGTRLRDKKIKSMLTELLRDFSNFYQLVKLCDRVIQELNW